MCRNLITFLCGFLINYVTFKDFVIMFCILTLGMAFIKIYSLIVDILSKLNNQIKGLLAHSEIIITDSLVTICSENNCISDIPVCGKYQS